MLKVMLCSRRHPSMTRSQFFRYLQETHAPLVLGVPEFLKYLRRYVQNHTLLAEDGVMVSTQYHRASDRDSVIELWFDDSKSLAAAMGEPRYMELVRPDEARFNDLTKLIVLMTEEEVIFDGSEGRLKVFDFIKRRDGINRDEFLEKWSRHGSRLAADAQYRDLIAKRIQNSALPNDGDAFAAAAAYDGVAELWVSSFEVLARLQGSRFRGCEEEFADAEASFSILATEVPIHDAVSAVAVSRR
jgi:hypothetical protein